MMKSNGAATKDLDSLRVGTPEQNSAFRYGIRIAELAAALYGMEAKSRNFVGENGRKMPRNFYDLSKPMRVEWYQGAMLLVDKRKGRMG